jgi:hypothetical protein
MVQGGVLDPLDGIIKRTGCVIIVMHHFKRALKPGAKPSLDHLSQAGLAAWAFNWILVSRRKPYSPTKASELWLTNGGRGNSGGEWALTVDERGDGSPGAAGDGRGWKLDIEPAAEEADEAGPSSKDAHKALKLKAAERKTLAAFEDEKPRSVKQLRKATGLSPDEQKAARASLTAAGKLHESDATRSGNECKVYTLQESVGGV